ncbi:ermin isoform X2 [Nannospalax galili]|uniref:ermin isoform X2 n=1 Tax=Nannospalax galili TaxID=1026970 RepID=UPI0004ED34E7|nr:ermin isoform X2 [Nannospalax galili]
MTDAPVTFSGTTCNGDRPPENDQQHNSQTKEDTADVDGTPPPCSFEPSPKDLSIQDQEESGKSKRNVLPKWPMDEKTLNDPEESLLVVHKAITDLSLQEASAEDMVFREGHQWKKIPLSSSYQEISRPKERIVHQPLEQRDENMAYQAPEIKWLGFKKPSQGDVIHSKHAEEQEVWMEEIDEDDVEDCNDDEDQVRVIEFKRKYEDSQLKEEVDASEDSPLSSPSSQPVTPDEQPMFGKKGDISRNAYSRYNTISYRKIRKGNTKQRIDEFESMMHL